MWLDYWSETSAESYKNVNTWCQSCDDDAYKKAAHFVIGYWENWVQSGVRVLLRDVSAGWDVVNVSFMLAAGSACHFTPDSSLYGAGAAGRAAFKQDVRFLQSRGQKVVLSFGGAQDYDYQLDTSTDRDNFLNTSTAILEEFGFDGLDIDIEMDYLNVTGETSITSPTKPSNVNLIYILQRIKQRFGEEFILSMTPEHPYVQGGAAAWGGWHSIFGGYLAVLNGVRSILTYISPQYYNNPIDEYTCCNGYNTDSLVGLSKMLIDGFDVVGHGHFDGLRPDQVAMTVLQAGTPNGALPLSDYKDALTRLLDEYPTFRGISVWSINRQWRDGVPDAFVDAMRTIIDGRKRRRGAASATLNRVMA